MRNVSTGSVNQSIVFHAFDADGAPVTLAHNAPGLSISYAIDVDGREGTPVALTPIARAVTGAHEDGAITSKGDGKHEVDLPDAAAATAGYVRLIVSATAVTGRVYSEVIAVGVLAELNTATISKIDSIKSTTDKIDTGLVLDGVAWQFTVNMLETAIAEVPKYGDAQRHTQEAYNLTNKTVDVTVTKIE